MQVILRGVRLAFPSLFKPSSFSNGVTPRYGATFILEPGSDNCKEIIKAITAVAEEKWGEKARTILAKLQREDRTCYKTSPYLNKFGEVYAGFEDKHWVRASNPVKPLVVDRNPRVSLTEEDGKVYAGAYVNAKLDLWAQDNQYGMRVNANLLVVQFVKDGEPFSGSVPTIDGLEDLSGEDNELADLI